jgi:phage tail tape-measure protein
MHFVRIAAALLTVTAGAAVGGCGGSNQAATVNTAAQREAIEKAKEEAVREAVEKERERQQAKRLQAQIDELKRRQRQAERRSQGSSSGANAADAQPSVPTSSCGGGIRVGPNTSCLFARNVVQAYYESGGGSTTVIAYSPVTDRSYSMYCQAGAQIVCAGANNASVFF